MYAGTVGDIRVARARAVCEISSPVAGAAAHFSPTAGRVAELTKKRVQRPLLEPS